MRCSILTRRARLHRVLRNVLLIAVLLAGAGVIVLMAKGDLTRNDALASVISTFVTLAALGLAVWTWPPPAPVGSDLGGLADALAETIRAQWQGESRARQLRDAPVLPLRGSVGGTVGRLAGTFDAAIEQMADAYHAAGIGRTVILGEPGAGKTVLAIMLTLGLLKSRLHGGPLPVLLGLSSWDPGYERLDAWIVRTVAQSYYNGQQDTPRALLDGGLLIPVLDGLDEIPEVSRRNAVEGINYIGDDRPVVVTCRSVEYDDVIKGGAVSLPRAPVVRVLPLEHDDVIDYLRTDGPWPSGTTWDGVSAELRRDRDGPLATALSTPLMVSLARMVYQRLGGDPGEMAERDRFPTRHAIEDHLVDRVIEAAYSPDPRPSGELVQKPAPVDPRQAERWLTYLAQYLNDHHERDLTWWRFADRMLTPWVAPAVGLVLGFVLLLIVSTAAVLADPDHDLENAFSEGAVLGGMIAVVCVVIWYATTGRRPGAISMAARGSVERLLRGVRVGAALTAVTAVPLFIVRWATVMVGGGHTTFLGIGNVVRSVALVAAIAGVLSAAVAAHNWFDARSERPVQADPLGFVAQDRWSALAGALAAAAVVAVTLYPVLWAVVTAGSILGDGFAGWLGKSGVADLDWTYLSGMDGLFVGGVAVFPGIAVGLLILLTRAWSRFVVARCVLAARRQLPLRLLRFLGDARRREVLRQSGGAYQFRHVRLQERLAARPRVFDRASAPSTPADRVMARRRRRVAAALAAPVMAAATVVVGVTFNELRCAGWAELRTETDQARVFADGGSYCIGVVRQDRWDELVLPGTREGAEGERRAAVLSALADGNAGAPADASMLAVFGPLASRDDRVRTTVLGQLGGVAAAQRSAARARQPLRIVLVDTGPGFSEESALFDESASAAASRLIDGSTRPGTPLPPMLVLDRGVSHFRNSVVSAWREWIEYQDLRRISIFSADPERFDTDLAVSTLWRFAPQRLGVDPDDIDSFPSGGSCYGAGQSVQWFFGPPNEFPSAFDRSYLCLDNQVSLLVEGPDVANVAKALITAMDGPDFTVYYPARVASAVTTCDGMVGDRDGPFPEPTHVCTPADRPALFAYRAVLAVAGLGEYTLYQVRCARPAPTAPVTCGEPVEMAAPREWQVVPQHHLPLTTPAPAPR